MIIIGTYMNVYDGILKLGNVKYYFVAGDIHREDGPAVEYIDGSTLWYIHGERIRTWKRYHELSTLSPQEQMIVKLKYGDQLK